MIGSRWLRAASNKASIWWISKKILFQKSKALHFFGQFMVPLSFSTELCVCGESIVFYRSLIWFSEHAGGLVFAFAAVIYDDLQRILRGELCFCISRWRTYCCFHSYLYKKKNLFKVVLGLNSQNWRPLWRYKHSHALTLSSPWANKWAHINSPTKYNHYTIFLPSKYHLYKCT